MAAAGDLSPLQGCWVGQRAGSEGTETGSRRCLGGAFDICFDERGQGQMTIEAKATNATFRAPAQAAYESGQLVINVGQGTNESGDLFSSLRIKCAPRGDKAANCVYQILDNFACAYGAGWLPASLKRR
jgi:hypothetical protein